MSKFTKADREESIATLREIVKPGDTLTTVLRHRAPSGMSRAVDLYKFSCEGNRVKRYWLSYQAARAAGFPFSEKFEAITMGGAGMDMGFHLVYSLSSVLFPDGFDCIGEGCPANDHVNDRVSNYGPRHHNDGGYAQNQEWL